ncbi:hypothetical protein B0O99DRAFT_526624 [Bisporella sp. PMI_857]|nr:hypothetical protein B0O99DRAFT_526624 [Bisporella sp. PMI_857]
MEEHEQFTEWALTQGVKINGVTVHKYSGRGLGIIATEKHAAGSTLVTVPATALRTAYTVPKELSEAIGPITVHGLLAAELALDTSPDRLPWRQVLPTPQEFQETMPLLWSPRLQSLLPHTSAQLLANQRRKLSLDFAAVSAAFPGIPYATYQQAWLVVNTRTFHYASPSKQHAKPSNPDDCMALNPYADYFNHTSAPGCVVTMNASGYTIVADQAIERGEEVYISYGPHSNDFLLAEYGFILDENRWDEVSLDGFILPLLSHSQKEQLVDAGFLGKYVLDADDVCYRTQVALRALCLSPRKVQQFIDGHDNSVADEVLVGSTLKKIIDLYLNHVGERMKQLHNIDCGIPSQREALSRRWNQIRLLLQNAKDRT